MPIAISSATFFVSSLFAVLLVIAVRLQQYHQFWRPPNFFQQPLPVHGAAALAQCQALLQTPGPSNDFFQRSFSDRFIPGTRSVLLQDARIWTGRENGTEVVRGDLYLSKGIVKHVGSTDAAFWESLTSDTTVIDLNGAWVTPGLVDAHSHIGIKPLPVLRATESDVNSLKGNVQPWLRSLDGLNTHDDSFPLAIAGGVTTALVLPGSANAIAGQAYVLKLRQTAEKSPSSMLVEPPYHINSSFPNHKLPKRWRYIKHTCGENPARVHKNTRMDNIWEMRKAYQAAFDLKSLQDDYCFNTFQGNWKNVPQVFPEELQWEALVGVLRGQVKVNAHCYEAADLDSLIRLSREFQFPIAAIHHASEAYLVPDRLKDAYGEPPALALFATFSRYKREAYRSSEFAPRILAQNGLKVVMKSDHPAINSRYLMYEAQQAFYYGLPWNLALASVMSNPAEVIGMDHRLGYINKGYDADIVLWDSHPLALGATPTQVYIDGIPQFDAPYVVRKPANYQHLPKVPNFDKEMNDTIEYEGLPPLLTERKAEDYVIFENISSIYSRVEGRIRNTFTAQSNEDKGVLIVVNGAVVCAGTSATCLQANAHNKLGRPKIIDLEGGSLTPGFITYGCAMGITQINQEPSTSDGFVFEPTNKTVPGILGAHFVARAIDGLQFGSRDALLAFKAGVTIGVTAPMGHSFYSGVSAAFALDAKDKLERGAIIREAAGVHLAINRLDSSPSVSSKVAVVRRLLRDGFYGFSGKWFEDVAKGKRPLVIEAYRADVIATLIALKQKLEEEMQSEIKMTITGAHEAHMLSKELAKAKIGVILTPDRVALVRPWEGQRVLPGPPFTRDTDVVKLIHDGVKVGMGCGALWPWAARNLPFDLARAAIDSGGRITKTEAIAMGTTNLESLLGLDLEDDEFDLVATVGSDMLDLSYKVKAIYSSRSRTLFEI